MLNGDTDVKADKADAKEAKADAPELKTLLRKLLESRQIRRNQGSNGSNPGGSRKYAEIPYRTKYHSSKKKIIFGKEFEAMPKKKKPKLIPLKPLSIKLYHCDMVKSVEKERKDKTNIGTQSKPVKPLEKLMLCGLCKKNVPEPLLQSHSDTHKNLLSSSDYARYCTFLDELCWDPCKENYMCPFSKCWVVFRVASFLRLHVQSHNMQYDILRNAALGAEMKDYIVESCKEAVVSEYLTSNLKFKCPMCGRLFSILTEFRTHIEIVHCCNQGSHFCSWCSLRFSDERVFQEHRRKRVPKQKCVPCRKEFATICLYVGHQGHTHGIPVSEERMKIVIEEIAQSNQKGIQKFDIIPEDNEAYDGPLEIRCDLCNRGFTDRCELLGHKKIHNKLNKNAKYSKRNTTVKNLFTTQIDLANKKRLGILNSANAKFYEGLIERPKTGRSQTVSHQANAKKSKSEEHQMQTQEIDISSQKSFEVKSITYNDFIDKYNINKQEIQIPDPSILKVDKVNFQAFTQMCKSVTESKGAHLCNICHIEFRSKSYLNAHLKMHKNSNPTITENIIGTQFVPIDVDGKIDEKKKVEVNEKLCETYPVKQEKEDMFYKCVYCGIEYVSKMALDSHLYTHAEQWQKNSEYQERLRHTDKSSPMSNPSEPAEENSDCTTHKYSRSDYVRHQADTHGLKLPESVKQNEHVTSKQPSGQTRKKISYKRYKKKDSSVIKLLIRLRKFRIPVKTRHNSSSKYTSLKCLICQLEFSKKSRFRIHMEGSHQLFKTKQQKTFQMYKYCRIVNRYVKNKYQLCKLVKMIEESCHIQSVACNNKKLRNVCRSNKNSSKVTDKKYVKYHGRGCIKDLVLSLERCDFIKYC